ncbi:MAG: Hpt domain-containing protein [Geminicoccaceae bacterium]
MPVQDQIRALVQGHCDRLPDHVDEIGGKLSRLVNAETDHAAHLGDLIELTHKLNGSSGSIGFRDVGAAAAALEEHLTELAQSQTKPEAPDLARILVLFNALERLASQATPEDSTLYHADLEPSGQAADA